MHLAGVVCSSGYDADSIWNGVRSKLDLPLPSEGSFSSAFQLVEKALRQDGAPVAFVFDSVFDLSSKAGGLENFVQQLRSLQTPSTNVGDGNDEDAEDKR